MGAVGFVCRWSMSLACTVALLCQAGRVTELKLRLCFSVKRPASLTLLAIRQMISNRKSHLLCHSHPDTQYSKPLPRPGCTQSVNLTFHPPHAPRLPSHAKIAIDITLLPPSTLPSHPSPSSATTTNASFIPSKFHPRTPAPAPALPIPNHIPSIQIREHGVESREIYLL